MKILSKLIFNAPAFENFNEFEKHIKKESGLDTNLDKPLRYLLTGSENGPELAKIYPLIKSYILEVAS